MDRADIIDQNFRKRVRAQDFPSAPSGQCSLSKDDALAIFEAQCVSRNLDRRARKMQAAGQGYYTIGSSGHEGMAAVAHALRPTDMAFLHYRDGAFQAMRAQQVTGINPIRDMLLSFATAREDPISGGRHKVLGSKALAIPPQTSTIASHLPKAVGAAYSIPLARKCQPEHSSLPADSLVMCSFGDASANHSTAQGAINSACWASYRGAPLPLLFICEDNQIGISTPTPEGWIAQNFSNRPGLKYYAANGLDISDTYTITKQAADFVRKYKKPAFLHLNLVRLYGHAGADLQQSYLSREIFEAWEADDPLLHSARLLAQEGFMSPEQILDFYQKIEDQCREEAEYVATRPHLAKAAEVMSSLIPPKRDLKPANRPDPEQRKAMFGGEFAQMDTPQTMAKLINWTLSDLMLSHREIVMMGEDIGRKGGVYGVTQRVMERHGAARVIDTLLDEQSILGLAIGMAHNGFIPIPEIQFLAYLHNAEDQIRGEAATLPFFSNGQFSNPMVVRIAGLGYQKGFGGHFHNDNSLAVLRDIPGLVIACPSRADDAAMMLRESVRLAREEQRIVAFIEPIALYHTRDLHEAKDNAWLSTYPDPERHVPLGEVGVTGNGPLAIISYGNGHYLAQQARASLEQAGIPTRIIDLRWLAPMPKDSLLGALDGARKVLVVDECRRTGGQAEALMAFLYEETPFPHARLCAEDSFIPTGPAYASTLPSKEGIIAAAHALWNED